MRTILYPSNAEEEAVQAGLDSLRAALRSLRQEIDHPEPELMIIAQLADELGRAARSVVSRSKRLGADSPYWPAAIEEAREALEGARGLGKRIGGVVEDAIAFEEDLADVLLAAEKLKIGRAVHAARAKRNWSLRALCERAGLAIGYLSDLERGRTGVPSEAAAKALDEVLGTGVAAQRAKLLPELSSLRHKGRERRLRQPEPGLRDPRLSVRLAAISDALARDEGLRVTIERLLEMSDSVRSGIRKLVEELARE